MKTKDLRGSITVAEDAKKKKTPVEDDNPEGVNQYSGGAAKALAEAKARHDAATGGKMSRSGEKARIDKVKEGGAHGNFVERAAYRLMQSVTRHKGE